MALSPNYSWAEPDNSSLVKNGAADIRTLGDAIDTSVWNVGFGQAGKNKIINGDFRIWQRGTSFAYTGSAATIYTADRFAQFVNGDGSFTFSQQIFTSGTAPVAGYEGSFFSRFAVNTVGTSTVGIINNQRIEDVRTFAGQTVTLSFWAKVNSGTPTLTLKIRQNFGSGGSAFVDATDVNVTLSSSWARYTATFAIPSISGKTIGTSSYLDVQFRITPTSSLTLDTWGVQVEYGSKATPFQTASGGSPQAELAMCQRYYFRTGGSAAYERLTTMASGASSTSITATLAPPVSMRIAPSVVDYATLTFWDGTGGLGTITSLTIATAGKNMTEFTVAISAGGITTYRPYYILTNGSTNGYLGLSAEL